MVVTALASTRSSGPWCARARRSTATSSSGSSTDGGASSRAARCRSTSHCHAGQPAAGRHGPRHVAHEPLQGRRWRRRREARRWKTTASTHSSRSAARTPSASPTSSSREGVPVVGVPKTIDNDLSATEVTFGFHTAVQIATDAIDRLHTTAESHDRVMVCEVMGRHAGWIATYSGIAAGACRDPDPRGAVRHRASSAR